MREFVSNASQGPWPAALPVFRRGLAASRMEKRGPQKEVPMGGRAGFAHIRKYRLCRCGRSVQPASPDDRSRRPLPSKCSAFTARRPQHKSQPQPSLRLACRWSAGTNPGVDLSFSVQTSQRPSTVSNSSQQSQSAAWACRTTPARPGEEKVEKKRSEKKRSHPPNTGKIYASRQVLDVTSGGGVVKSHKCHTHRGISLAEWCIMF